MFGPAAFWGTSAPELELGTPSYPPPHFCTLPRSSIPLHPSSHPPLVGDGPDAGAFPDSFTTMPHLGWDYPPQRQISPGTVPASGFPGANAACTMDHSSGYEAPAPSSSGYWSPALLQPPQGAFAVPAPTPDTRSSVTRAGCATWPPAPGAPSIPKVRRIPMLAHTGLL